jgi:hypothetical protein
MHLYWRCTSFFFFFFFFCHSLFPEQYGSVASIVRGYMQLMCFFFLFFGFSLVVMGSWTQSLVDAKHLITELHLKPPLVLFCFTFFLFCSAGDQILGLVHARKALCLWVTFPTCAILYKVWPSRRFGVLRASCPQSPMDTKDICAASWSIERNRGLWGGNNTSYGRVRRGIVW